MKDGKCEFSWPPEVVNVVTVVEWRFAFPHFPWLVFEPGLLLKGSNEIHVIALPDLLLCCDLSSETQLLRWIQI